MNRKEKKALKAKKKAEEEKRKKAEREIAKKKRELRKGRRGNDSLLPKKQPLHMCNLERTQSLIQDMFDDEKDGIFRKGNVYSKMYEFEDTSFARAELDDQIATIKKWIEFLHSFNDRMHIQVMIASAPLKEKNLIREYSIPDVENKEEQVLVDEMNELIKKTIGINNDTAVTQKRYIVVSTVAEDYKEAKNDFMGIGLKIESKFKEMKSTLTECDAHERYEFLYNFFKGHKIEDDTSLSLPEYAKQQGVSLYDSLSPDCIKFRDKDYFIIKNGDEERYGRVLFVQNYSSSITPRFFNRLMTMYDTDITISMGITPITGARAMKRVEKQISGMKAERLDKIKRALKSGYSYEAVTDEKLEDSLNNALELKQALQSGNQKLFKTHIMILIKADSLSELENITLKVMDRAAEQLVTVGYLNFQQPEGIETVMPFADNRIQIQRTLTSDALACNIPFNTKEIMHPKSIYYGMNLVSKNAVFADRKKLINGNGCVLATSGAGKSFSVKMMIEQILLRYPKDDVIVIDPQQEYDPLIRFFKGQSVIISTTSDTHINPFDLDLSYDDKSPVKAKTEYITAFFDTIVSGGLNGVEKSIIDRCCMQSFEAYEMSGFKDKLLQPSIPSFYQILKSQPEREAKQLAINIERFATGTTDIFSKKTNVDIHNRFVSFDISKLTASLQTTGYLVVLDHIQNTLSKNKKEGKNTWIFIDEFHVLLNNQFSAEYVAKFYKEGRKFGAIPTIITQNISDVLNNEQGNKILSNSEFALILKQKPIDLVNVAALFGISESEQASIGKTCQPGQGILVYDDSRVIFRNVVSKNSLLYKLNNTDLIVQARG